MIGLGTVFNVGAIIIGSIIGLILKNNLKERYKLVVIQGIGLSIVVIGVSGAISGLMKDNNNFLFLYIILSIVLGGFIGAFLRIEERLNSLGDHVQKKFVNSNSNFSKGFITASLIFCVGSMAIMGSISDGLSGDYSTLAIKSILDGVTSMILASTLGIGVAFSAIPVLLYQGTITVIAFLLNDFIPEIIKNQMIIIGNILVIGIGIELLEIKKIKLADLLPSIFLPLIIYYLLELLKFCTQLIF